MLNYHIHNDHVHVTFRNGKEKRFFFTHDTGQAYYRFKLNSAHRIRHTGIFLGLDEKGRGYFIHNHIIHGKATIVDRAEFSQSMPVYKIPRRSVNSPLRVIELALEQVKEGASYRVLRNNCQTLTNWSCHNSRHSEDVRKWSGISSVGLTLLAIGTGLLLGRKRR